MNFNDPLLNRIDEESIKKQMNEVYYIQGNLSSFFTSSEEISNALEAILSRKGFDDANFMQNISILFKIVIPFIIILVIAITSWIICCSCCCYDYCQVMCKKPENFEDSNSIRMKIIPIVILIFFGFKSLIPMFYDRISFK